MSTILPNSILEISYLFTELESRGIDLQKLGGVGAALEGLMSSSGSPDAESIQQRLEAVLELLPDDGLGLCAGSRETIADYGAFGHAMLSSKNLRAVHDFVLRYRKILQMVYGVRFSYGAHRFQAQMTDLRVSGRSARFFSECWLQTHFRFTQLLVNEPRPFKSVTVAYAPPPYAHAYRSAFGCAVEFGAEFTGYEASSTLLDRGLSFANDEVRTFCEARCDELLLVMEAGEDTVTRVRRALMRRPGWFPGADEMAKCLGLSPRTFRRRLREEHSSYHVVVETVRKELAADFLRNTHLTVEDIAHRLGYVEANSFYKAFRRWYGTSPKAFLQPA